VPRADFVDAAARPAQVADGHAVVPVAAGFQAHPLEQLVRPAFVLPTALGARSQLLQPRRESVARGLELAEPGQVRPGSADGAGHRRRRGQEGEAVGQQL
jgi:hypothetical protein